MRAAQHTPDTTPEVGATGCDAAECGAAGCDAAEVGASEGVRDWFGAQHLGAAARTTCTCARDSPPHNGTACCAGGCPPHSEENVFHLSLPITHMDSEARMCANLAQRAYDDPKMPRENEFVGAGGLRYDHLEDFDHRELVAYTSNTVLLIGFKGTNKEGEDADE